MHVQVHFEHVNSSVNRIVDSQECSYPASRDTTKKGEEGEREWERQSALVSRNEKQEHFDGGSTLIENPHYLAREYSNGGPHCALTGTSALLRATQNNRETYTIALGNRGQ